MDALGGQAAGSRQQAAGSQLTSILCRISASVSRLAQADGDSLFAETGGFGSHGVRWVDKDVRNDVPAATGVDAEERPEAHVLRTSSIERGVKARLQSSRGHKSSVHSITICTPTLRNLP
jgi:hypothetical protein